MWCLGEAERGSEQTSRKLEGGAAVCSDPRGSVGLRVGAADFVAQNRAQLALDLLLQGERIERFQEFFQARELARWRALGGHWGHV